MLLTTCIDIDLALTNVRCRGVIDSTFDYLPQRDQGSRLEPGIFNFQNIHYVEAVLYGDFIECNIHAPTTGSRAISWVSEGATNEVWELRRLFPSLWAQMSSSGQTMPSLWQEGTLCPMLS